MIKHGVFLFMQLLSVFLFGKDSIPKSPNRNSIQFELFGNGILYSINYERILNKKTSYQFCSRLGFTYLPNTATSQSSLGFTGEFNLLMGKKNKFLEIGSGFTYWNNTEDYYYSTGFYVPRIGLRYKFPNGKSFIRVGFTPLININTDSRVNVTPKFSPFGGLAIGYSF